MSEHPVPQRGHRMNRLPQVFRHEMVVHRTEDEFLEATRRFAGEASGDGVPVLAMVSARHAASMRDALGRGAGPVEFVDAEAVGRNPARMMPMWSAFAGRHRGSAVAGICEPIWPARAPAAVEEAQRHEHLLNLAFAHGPELRLLCAFDAAGLDDAVVTRALASHAHCNGEPLARSPAPVNYRDVAFGGTLPEHPARATAFMFASTRLHELRDIVARLANQAGLEATRVSAIVLAVDEAASNSIRYGGGTGTLRVWADGPAIVCEVCDHGRISDPLAGRARPDADQPGHRGLWLANQLCDLVQIRSGEQGTTVRMSMGPG